MSTETKIIKNKLTCAVTGIVVSVAPKVFDQRVVKYGSIENLKLNYISAVGRKLLCAGKSVQDIRTQYNVSSNVPLPSEEIIKKYTKWAKYRKAKINLTPLTNHEQQIN